MLVQRESQELIALHLHSMLIEQLQGASSERQQISLEVDYVDAPTAEEEEYYLNVIQPQALAVAARAPKVEADGRRP